MRIGELAKRTELSRDTIRFYERHGLIQSRVDADAPNSYRIYAEDAVLTLDVIRDAQAAGLSIADITVFLGQFMAMDPDIPDGEGFLDTKINEVRARIDASSRFLALLNQTKEALKRAPQDGLDEMNAAGAGNELRSHVTTSSDLK